MKKRTKRLLTWCITLALFVCNSISTIAAETTKVKVTEEMVLQMAERFASGINPKVTLEAINPMKFYDESGQAIGYIVNYCKSGVASGYVIFDSTHEGLISEYTFDVDAKNPYDTIVDAYNLKESLVTRKSTSLLYKISPFTYGLIDSEDKVYLDNYGKKTNIERPSTNNRTRNSISSWDDVLFEIDEVYGDYTIVEMNHIWEFIGFDQDYITEETNRYACGVTALYACAMYYDAVDYGDLFGDYVDLWEFTDTTLLSVGGEYSTGSTNVYNIGPGFVSYCASRGVEVSQFTKRSPSYSLFKNCIDDGGVAVVSMGVEKQDGGEVVEVGHAMAVEGYATIREDNGGDTIQTLMVYDGWNSYVRYLNYDFESWTYMYATTFSN